jgi:hypothetical protein
MRVSSIIKCFVIILLIIIVFTQGVSAISQNLILDNTKIYDRQQNNLPKNHIVIGIMKYIGSSTEYDIKGEVIFTLILHYDGLGSFHLFSAPKGSILLLNDFKGFAKLFILFGVCSDYNIQDISYGIIFGKTWGVFEHATWLVPVIKIEIEGKTIYSSWFSRYKISGLELGYTYEIKASNPGYYNRTYQVELTAEEPCKFLDIYLIIN